MRDHVQAPPNKSQSTAFSEKILAFSIILYLGLKLRDEDVPDSGVGGNKDVPEEDAVDDEEEAAKPENDTNEENEDKDLKPDRNRSQTSQPW